MSEELKQGDFAVFRGLPVVIKEICETGVPYAKIELCLELCDDEESHIDRAEKSFCIGDAVRLGFAFEKIEAEINKCQVLCANCHRIKTHEEGIGLQIRV